MKRSFVLLRGLGHESRHWGEFYKVLTKQEYCSKIYLCDLPGAGVFHKEEGVASVPQMVEHLVKHCQPKFINDKPVSIIALSLGGMVALEYLASLPDLFSEFFIINSSIGSLSPFYKRMKPSALATVFKIGVERNRMKREDMVINLTSQLRKTDADVLKEHVEIAKTAPMSFTTLIRQLYAGVRYQGPYTSIHKPGLILCSKHDDLVNPDCSFDLARHLKVKAVCHETAGHDLTLDDPQWVAARIGEFLKNLEV